MSNLLSVLHFSFTTLLKKWAKEKKAIIPFWGKKTEEKQNRATIMTSIEGQGTIFPVELKLQGESLNKDIKKESFKKYLIKLIEINH